MELSEIISYCRYCNNISLKSMNSEIASNLCKGILFVSERNSSFFAFMGLWLGRSTCRVMNLKIQQHYYRMSMSLRNADNYRLSNLRNADVTFQYSYLPPVVVCITHPKGRKGSIEVGSIPVAILPSCQEMKAITFQLH